MSTRPVGRGVDGMPFGIGQSSGSWLLDAADEAQVRGRAGESSGGSGSGAGRSRRTGSGSSVGDGHEAVPGTRSTWPGRIRLGSAPTTSRLSPPPSRPGACDVGRAGARRAGAGRRCSTASRRTGRGSGPRHVRAGAVGSAAAAGVGAVSGGRCAWVRRPVEHRPGRRAGRSVSRTSAAGRRRATRTPPCGATTAVPTAPATRPTPDASLHRLAHDRRGDGAREVAPMGLPPAQRSRSSSASTRVSATPRASQPSDQPAGDRRRGGDGRVRAGRRVADAGEERSGRGRPARVPAAQSDQPSGESGRDRRRRSSNTSVYLCLLLTAFIGRRGRTVKGSRRVLDGCPWADAPVRRVRGCVLVA